jgi:hypothetical protein
MGKTEQCAFCPAKADDGEHIWSDWFGKLLPPSNFNMIRKELDGNVREWRKQKLNEKTYVVCGPCNHGWMSDIENEVKQVIRDMAASCREKTLTGSDIETIAQFTFLKSVVADHSHDNFEPFFSTNERWNFRNFRELPSGFQVWIASTPTQHGLFKSFYSKTPQNMPRRFEINAFTYGLGHLVSQATTSKWMKKANRKYRPPPVLTQSAEWDVVATPIWPYTKAISWPPSQHMDHGIVDAFAQRWKDLNRTW